MNCNNCEVCTPPPLAAVKRELVRKLASMMAATLKEVRRGK